MSSPYTTSTAAIVTTASDEERAAAAIVSQLNSLLKAAQMYAPGHPSVGDHADRFLRQLFAQFEILGVDELQLVFTSEYLYLGRNAVRPDAKLRERAEWLQEQFLALQVTEIVFRAALTRPEVEAFCQRFVSAQGHPERFPTVDAGSAIDVLRSSPPPELNELIGHLRHLNRFPLLQLYAEGLALTREWARAMRRGHHTADVIAKRVVGQLIDAFNAEPSGLLGLVTVRPLPGSYTNRRFDSALVAVGLTKTIGMSDRAAMEVGVAALVRPTPEPWTPWWVRRALPPDEAAQVASGATNALERILAYESAGPMGLEMPSTYYGEARPKHLVTRIAQLAEAYVDLLQPGEASSPFSPEMAIQLLLAQAGRLFDPELVGALVGMLGYWPPGTIVRLNSGDLAVVSNAPPRGQDLRRPTVRPLALDTAQVYPLYKPQLRAYVIDGSVPRAACPCNPAFVFLL